MSGTEKFIDFARLRPVRTRDEVVLLESLARVDDHNVIAPTHVVLKHGLPIGHFSIAGIPLWMGHLSVKDTSPGDTFRLIHIVESMLELSRHPATLTLVGKESRLHPKMNELGYKCVGNADIFIKEFI